MNTLFLAALVVEGVVAIGFIGLPVQLLGPWASRSTRRRPRSRGSSARRC